MPTIIEDLRYGLRMLMKNPGFTAAAVLCLGLGIGASTAIFSVVNVVLLDPLPAKDSGRLMAISEFNVAKDQEMPVSPPLFSDLQKQKDVFEDISAFGCHSLVLAGEDSPEMIYGFEVTPNFFTLLGAQPMAGRTFSPQEGQPGNDRVLIVSHGFWQRRFGSDPNLVGRTVPLGDQRSGYQPYTVIGIMPAEFQFPRRAELGEFWKPHAITAKDYSHSSARIFRMWDVAARLRPGISRRRAQAAVDTIARRLEKDFPQTNTGWRIRIKALRNMFSNEKLQQTLLGLLGAIVFVLLIACANIGNLLLARGQTRAKELAVRVALGAGRFRIVRQLLTESVLLALIGGTLGLVVTYWTIDVLTARIPASIPRMKEIGVDARMLGLACLLSVLTGAGFGLVPAWRASKPRLTEALKEGGRSSYVGSRRRYCPSLLVVTEMALTLVLLAGSGLMIRSVVRLLRVNPGFDAHNLLRIGVSFPFLPKYKQFARREALIQQLAERFRTLPGVQAVGFDAPGHGWEHMAEGQTTPIDLYSRCCGVGGDDYFKATRTALLKGRYFTQEDTHSSQRTIIINNTMARLCWPGENPLGKRLKHIDAAWANAYTVIGVVGDVKDVRLDVEQGPMFYVPYQRSQPNYICFMVRVRAGFDPFGLSKPIRHEIKTLDPSLPVPEVGSVEKELFDSTSPHRTYMKLMGLFAGVGLLLAAVGIYGVISYSVTQRTHEIGVRMALGAQTPDVLQMVIKQGFTLALIGVAVGLGAALALTRVISSLLYNISPTDPVTFTCVSLLLTGIAVAACYIPARRAAKLEPMSALRYE